MGKLQNAGAAEALPRGFDVILLQELPGQWAHPMTPEEVKELLLPVFPSY